MKNNVVNDKKICVTLQQFKDFFLTHNYNDNMFNSDGSINTKYNSNKKTGVIAQIFEEHWDKFYIENKIMIYIIAKTRLASRIFGIQRFFNFLDDFPII